MKRKAEVWKYINKKRGVRKWNDNDIEKEEWKRHFIELLEDEEDEETSSFFSALLPRSLRTFLLLPGFI